MREPMDEITNPETENVVFMSSSQVGKTEMILNGIGYYTHQDPSPMLCVEPTLDIAQAFSKDRLASMIRDTQVLSEIIRESRSKVSENTILHKKFPGGHITLAGSNSPAGLSSRPIRIVWMDEVDRYAPSAGSEGDPVTLATKRTTTFWNKKRIYVSTPTIKNLSRIEAAFLASDRRYYHVPCYKCGKSQKLEWERVHWEKDGGKHRPETALYVCAHCGAGWSDADRHDAIHAGKWIAEAAFTDTAGFHIWEAYNPWVRLREMVSAFLKANDASEKGDPEPLRAFVNTSLGETWVEKGETVAPDPLLARRENYAADAIPYRVLYLTGGVDVQDDRIELEVVGFRADKRNEPEESWGIEVIVLHGDPAKSEIWDELDDITKREWTTEDGRRLRLSAVCIDSGGHHTNQVYKFASRRIGRRIYAVKGMAGVRPIWPTVAGKSKKYKGSRVWIVGVDTAKDTIYARLRIKDPGPGYSHFPMSYDYDYFKGLTCEQVQTRFVKGHPVREWHKPPGVRNEPLDRRAYALAALYCRAVPWEILVRAAPSEPPPAGADVQGSTFDVPRENPPDHPEPPKPKFAARRVRARYR